MVDKAKLHPTVQKMVAVWPIVAAAGSILIAGVAASAQMSDQIGTNKSDIADIKRRMDRFESTVSGMSGDIRAIRQQTEDIEKWLNPHDGEHDDRHRS